MEVITVIRALNVALGAFCAVAAFYVAWRASRATNWWQQIARYGYGLVLAVVVYGQVEAIHEHGVYGWRLPLTTTALGVSFIGMVAWLYHTERDRRWRK